MAKRVLTIQVEVEQPPGKFPEDAEWIWKSHLNQKTPIHGCVVKVIAEGRLQDIIDDYIEDNKDEEGL